MLAIPKLQRQCDKENDRAFCKDPFLKAVRKFMEMKTLTPTILHELVERIGVYQTQGKGKNRTQRIATHYNFIGVLDLPEVAECPENVVLDSRQGVAIEYLVGKAKKTERPESRSTEADRPTEIAKEQPFDCSFTYKCSVSL